MDVFIPVYNGRNFLAQAIGSALKQSGVTARVIVSDNASNDGTNELLAELAAADDRVRVHRNSHNLGIVANFNRFREFVESDYFMILCSDDMLRTPDALRRAADILEGDDEIVSVYCDLEYIDASGASIAERRFKRRGRFSADDALRASLVNHRNMFGIPLLNRTSVWRNIAFPDGLTYVGDIHASMQAARLGLVYHLPDVLIKNRYTGSNTTASVLAESRAQFERIRSEFGVDLTSLERLRQRVLRPATLLAKMAFLSLMRLRSGA